MHVLIILYLVWLSIKLNANMIYTCETIIILPELAQVQYSSPKSLFACLYYLWQLRSKFPSDYLKI
jgi:hypothetical protein